MNSSIRLGRYGIFLTGCIIFFILSACTAEKFAEEALPKHIQQEGSQIVDAIMNGDAQYFVQRKADLLPPEQLKIIDNQEFKQKITRSFSQGSVSKEISRRIIGFYISVNASLDKKPVNMYDIVYEVETLDNFVVVSLRLSTRSTTGDCCEIKSIEVRNFEVSPF